MRQRNLFATPAGVIEKEPGEPAPYAAHGAVCAHGPHEDALVFYAPTRAEAVEMRAEHQAREGCEPA